jgi:predicted  nucleic acid-binding Zn-ribbon protein
MTGPGATLRQIHTLQQAAHGLREQLARLPHQLKAQKARVARQEDALRETQDALKRLKVKIHEREGSLKGKHQQIKKYEEQQRGSTSTKEYDAFKTEIGHARQECQALEEEILAAMVELDERTAALPGQEKELAEARADSARFEESAKERQESLAADLERVQRELGEVEAGLPPTVLPQYKRVVQALGAGALAAARGGACGACSTGLTAQNQNDLLMGKFFVCKACGRILYLPD